MQVREEVRTHLVGEDHYGWMGRNIRILKFRVQRTNVCKLQF